MKAPVGWATLVAINLGVTVALFAGALLAAEAFLHATIPASSGGSLFESTLSTKRYKLMKRNFSIVAYGSEFRTNELGFRDRAPKVPVKRPGGFRTIVLGDSFTAAAGVDFDKIYTSLFQDALQRRIVGADVLNLAVGGYNPIQEELVLTEVGLSLEPDFVIVAVFPFNDLENDTYRANYRDAMGTSTPNPVAWYKNTYVYRAYLGRVEGRIRSLLTPRRSATPNPEAAEQRKRDADENLAALERIVETSAAHGLGVAVVLLPNTDGFEAQRTDFAPFVALCQAHQWNCLNLLDGFIRSGERPASLRLNVLDPHPNERYNRLAAALLEASLLPTLEARARGSRNATDRADRGGDR